MPERLPEGLLDLLRKPSPCFVATLMPDGSPQLTQTWVTTDGEAIVLNLVDGMQKMRNIARDPRVAVNVADPQDTSRYYAVRGRVINMTTERGPRALTKYPTSISVCPTRISAVGRKPACSRRSRPTRSCRRGSERPQPCCLG